MRQVHRNLGMRSPVAYVFGLMGRANLSFDSAFEIFSGLAQERRPPSVETRCCCHTNEHAAFATGKLRARSGIDPNHENQDTEFCG